MAVELSINKATSDDARELAVALRPADELELRDSTGLDPLPVIINGIVKSAECYAIRFNDRIAMIYGIVHDASHKEGRLGVGWLLTTRMVEKHPVTFWKLCIRSFPVILARWDALVNYIDMRHKSALKWGHRLGFQFSLPVPFGPKGLPFARFIVTRETLRCAHQLQ